MDDQDNPLERDHCLSLILPGGLEKTATVHGSEPVMDLLVTLCARYHLNPSDYTVDILSLNKNNISFKPNSPIGLLEAERVVLKPKVVEEKPKRPYTPEATVRLLINYKTSHKAVVRVNPRVPLELLMPAVCHKCEFNVETTILYRDQQSEEPLDLTRSLSDHGLREVFAKDTAAVIPKEASSPPPLQEFVQNINPPKKEVKQKNKGFFCLFRRRKKKPEMEAPVSTPASPGLSKQLAMSVSSLGVSSSNTLPADMPKKRRAPQPPMGASLSVPNYLTTHHLGGPQGSAESSLRRTKKKAPPPPCANSQPDLPLDTAVTGTVNSLHTLEEHRDDEAHSVNLFPSLSSSHSAPPLSSSSSSPPSPRSTTPLREGNNQYLPKCQRVGNEISNARFALAEILTCSISSGELVNRLKNSATFPQIHRGSSHVSLTQRCPKIRGLFHELGSDLKSNISTQLDWEDPVMKKGITTFKVVPLKKQRSFVVELNQEVPENTRKTEDNRSPTRDVSSETRDSPTETREDPDSAEMASTEIPIPNSELCPLGVQVCDNQSTSPLLSDPENVDGWTSPGVEFQEELEKSELITNETLLDQRDRELADDGNVENEPHGASLRDSSDQNLNMEMEESQWEGKEKAAEEEGAQQEEEEHFPPPPPPVFYSEEIEDMEEGREDSVSSSLPSSQPSSPSPSGQHSDRLAELTSAKLCPPPTAPKPLKRMNTIPSRFAQAVALAVQRSRSQNQGRVVCNLLVSRNPSITSPAPLEPQTNSGPDWLPHTSLNGSSCLG